MATPSIRIARTCSQCGNYGHNARTCTEQMRPSHARTCCDDDSNSNGGEGVMLFGVRLTKPLENNSTSPGSMEASSSSSSSMKYRKCMSMDNLAQYEQQQQQQQRRCHDVGYASDDGVHASGSHNRERKRGVPWTEEEHRSFLVGLNQVGKGDWRGISRNFVKTRSPTQVASHAQKYFLRRRTNNNRRRRRNSVFDITTDTMSRSASADQLHNLEATFHQNQAKNPSTLFTSPCPPTLQPISTNHQHTKASVPPSLRMASLNLNESPMSSPTYSTSTSSPRGEFSPFLSLKPSQAQSNDDTSRSSNFQGFNSSGRDNIISVA